MRLSVISNDLGAVVTSLTVFGEALSLRVVAWFLQDAGALGPAQQTLVCPRRLLSPLLPAAADVEMQCAG